MLFLWGLRDIFMKNLLFGMPSFNWLFCLKITLYLVCSYLRFFSILKTLGHCMENVTPEGDTWHLPEALSISCQAQRREVTMGCSSAALQGLIYKCLLMCPQAAKSLQFLDYI